MAEVIQQSDPLFDRLERLVVTVRAWKELLADALAERGPVTEEERVEYLVGLLDPEPSWRAVSIEQALAFPGATAAAYAVLRELLAALEELLLYGGARGSVDQFALDVSDAAQRDSSL